MLQRYILAVTAAWIMFGEDKIVSLVIYLLKINLDI